MKKRLIVLMSIIIASVLMSGGYSLWERTLTIKGSIEILPEPTPTLVLNSSNDMTVYDAVYTEDTSVIDAVYGEDTAVVESIGIKESTLQP